MGRALMAIESELYDELSVADARAILLRDMDDDAKAAAWARKFGKAALDMLQDLICRGGWWDDDG
jgi:hypothetical protein